MSNIRILEIRAAEARQAELVRRLAAEEPRHRLPDFARNLGLPAALLLSAFLVSAFGA
ncbi:hypothetical protein [Dongia sp.]|uniref:hypothetical protein n=1 Tax=Dongia sp. TaxID=1977262 RepID=UPI0035B123C2